MLAFSIATVFNSLIIITLNVLTSVYDHESERPLLLLLLVFTTTEGMSDECQRYHSLLAQLLAVKKQELRFHYRLD